LACARNESVTFSHKLEELYAYFSTAGEDARFFHLLSTDPVERKRHDSVGGIPEGSRVEHPTRGAGRVVRIDQHNPRGKPVAVQFHNGEVHHYGMASAIKLLVVGSPRSSLTRTASLGLRKSRFYALYSSLVKTPAESERAPASPSVVDKEASLSQDDASMACPDATQNAAPTCTAFPRDAVEAKHLAPSDISSANVIAFGTQQCASRGVPQDGSSDAKSTFPPTTAYKGHMAESGIDMASEGEGFWV
jgi:hypothetical protein